MLRFSVLVRLSDGDQLSQLVGENVTVGIDMLGKDRSTSFLPVNCVLVPPMLGAKRPIFVWKLTCEEIEPSTCRGSKVVCR